VTQVSEKSWELARARLLFFPKLSAFVGCTDTASVLPATPPVESTSGGYTDMASLASFTQGISTTDPVSVLPMNQYY
jgi:hypothetical protein